MNLGRDISKMTRWPAARTSETGSVREITKAKRKARMSSGTAEETLGKLVKGIYPAHTNAASGGQAHVHSPRSQVSQVRAARKNSSSSNRAPRPSAAPPCGNSLGLIHVTTMNHESSSNLSRDQLKIRFTLQTDPTEKQRFGYGGSRKGIFFWAEKVYFPGHKGDRAHRGRLWAAKTGSP